MFRICVLFAAMGSVAEIVIYLHDASTRALFLPNLLYRIRFIYVPSSLNIIVILLTFFCLRSKKMSNRFKNVWACILIYFLCANTQVIHYVYGPLLMLPSIAIFMTILFYDRKLTTGMLIASLISLYFAHRQAAIELRKDDPQLPIDTVLAALVMLVAYIAAMLLTRYVLEQTRFILSSNERQRQLIEECNMDPLMGIGNRRALQARLEKILTESENDDCPVQLMLLDIDDFKRINDTYGHVSGDEVLMGLARIVRQYVAQGKEGNGIEAYRYGGEEVILILQESNEEAAFFMAEKIRKEFSQLKFSFDPKIRITFSAGIVPVNHDLSVEEWIEQTDARLYQAKTDGKNRVYYQEG